MNYLFSVFITLSSLTNQEDRSSLVTNAEFTQIVAIELCANDSICEFNFSNVRPLVACCYDTVTRQIRYDQGVYYDPVDMLDSLGNSKSYTSLHFSKKTPDICVSTRSIRSVFKNYSFRGRKPGFNYLLYYIKGTAQSIGKKQILVPNFTPSVRKKDLFKLIEADVFNIQQITEMSPFNVVKER